MGNDHEPIPLSAEDRAEGLRLERALSMAHDLMHAAQNDLNRFVAHMGALYGVPGGWRLTDWLKGFEAPELTVPVGDEPEPERMHNHHG